MNLVNHRDDGYYDYKHEGGDDDGNDVSRGIAWLILLYAVLAVVGLCAYGVSVYHRNDPGFLGGPPNGPGDAQKAGAK